jgi:hypothetical protein
MEAVDSFQTLDTYRPHYTYHISEELNLNTYAVEFKIAYKGKNVGWAFSEYQT